MRHYGKRGVTLGVYLPSEVADALQRMAAKSGLSPTKLARNAIMAAVRDGAQVPDFGDLRRFGRGVGNRANRASATVESDTREPIGNPQ